MDYVDPLDETVRLKNEATGVHEDVRRAELVERAFFAAHHASQQTDELLEGVKACYSQQSAFIARETDLRERDEKRSLIRMGVATVAGGLAVAYVASKSGEATNASQAAYRSAREARNEVREVAARVDGLEKLVRAADGRVAEGFSGLYSAAGGTRAAVRH